VVQETNSIVVTDSQEGIAQAERLVAQLDKKPAQVMIEARLVEMRIRNGFDIGVQWEFFDSHTTDGKTKFIGTTNKEDPRVIVGQNSDGDDIGASGPGAGTGVNLPGPAGAGITFGFVNNSSIISASLNALVTQSKAKILSSPKVVTVNGQEAKIEAVQDIPFKTAVVSANGAVTESFQLVSAGIILTVTPTINAEDRITLRVKPESSFPTQDTNGGNPIISTRKAQTTVSIKDGETLVIGGLISDSDTKGVSKVPLLGDIPIIGVFFRSNTNQKERSELLVFVTPRIIRD
jgi:type IV pilus secretin PilQ/predicted competence protein